MIKIGITGGTGLLGLLFKKKLRKKSIKFSEFKDDILKRKKVAIWISSNKNLEYIFHFAAISSTKKSALNKKKANNRFQIHNYFPPPEVPFVLNFEIVS